MAKPKPSHQIQRFKFRNTEEKAANDLTVEFNEKDVKTHDPGPFDKAVTKEKEIKLEDGDVPPQKTAKITFERDGEFTIKRWQWTLDGKGFGGWKDGPPTN